MYPFSYSKPSNNHIHRPLRWMPFLMLSIAPLCWAGNVVLARGVIDIIPPIGFAFWRWTTAFLILLPFSLNQVKKDWPMAKKGWKYLMLLSILGISCFNTLLYAAVHTTTAINAALIQTSLPAFIILISLFYYKERVTSIQIAGVTLCILGASLVVLHGQLERLLDLSLARGDILMILAVICYAFYSALLPKRPNIHMVSFLTYSFGLGAIGLLPAYIWELIRQGGVPITAHVIISILYVALFPSIIAYFCWNSGIETIGANKGGLFINLTPLFASLMSILWLGESLHSFHLLGMLLIGGGMLMFNRK